MAAGRSGSRDSLVERRHRGEIQDLKLALARRDRTSRRSPMLRQVADGVLTHQSELPQNNSVVVACMNGNDSASPKEARTTGRQGSPACAVSEWLRSYE